MQSSPDAARADPARSRAVELLFGLCVFAWVLRPIWDIDLFMHVAIGRLVLRSGLPSTDVLSAATPDAPWTPFQAGYELLVALLHDAVGLWGVNALHAALIALAFVLLRRRFAELTRSSSATLLLLALLFVTFEARVRPRPHVINLWLEALVLVPLAAGRLQAWLAASTAEQRPRHVWRAALALFAVAAFWSALHAMGALWLLAVLGAYAVVSETREQKQLAVVFCAVALAGIASVPGSAGGIVHVLRVQGQWREFVPELAPAWALISLGPSGILAFAATLLGFVCALLAALSKPARARYPSIACALGLAFGGLWIARLSYYAPFAIALVWPELQVFRGKLPGFVREHPARVARLASFVIALVLLLEVAPRYLRAGIVPWTTALHPGAFPVAELDTLARAGIRGRAFNEASWGGYALYALFPRVTVISDGRVTFGPGVAEVLRRMRDTPPEVVADVAHAAFGIDLLIWRRGRMQENPYWQVIVRGEHAEVFARTDDSLPARRRALLALEQRAQ
jgi:hypothetical protein